MNDEVPAGFFDADTLRKEYRRVDSCRNECLKHLKLLRCFAHSYNIDIYRQTGKSPEPKNRVPPVWDE